MLDLINNITSKLNKRENEFYLINCALCHLVKSKTPYSTIFHESNSGVPLHYVPCCSWLRPAIISHYGWSHFSVSAFCRVCGREYVYTRPRYWKSLCKQSRAFAKVFHRHHEFTKHSKLRFNIFGHYHTRDQLIRLPLIRYSHYKLIELKSGLIKAQINDASLTTVP